MKIPLQGADSKFPHENEFFGNSKMSKSSRKCSALDCPTGLKSHPEERSPTFPFPKDLEIRKQWIIRLNREFSKGTANHRVCERHFLPDDFVPDEENLTIEGKKKVFKRLKDHAVPSQNLSNSQKLVSLEFCVEHNIQGGKFWVGTLYQKWPSKYI